MSVIDTTCLEFITSERRTIVTSDDSWHTVSSENLAIVDFTDVDDTTSTSGNRE